MTAPAPATVVHSLDPSTFTADYLGPRRPVLVRGALDGSPPPPWPLETLAERFGDRRVPLYDTLFGLQGVTTFARYVERFTGDRHASAPPYLRWFARHSDERRPWADEAFAELEADWSQPGWLPRGEYVFPPASGPVDAAADPFPAKGLFLCGRGGRTRLHVDPWQSDACLCQTTGFKRVVMFAPEAASLLGDERELVDLDDPQDARFPHWRSAMPAFDEVLHPGDAVYIPAGWPHAATALSDSCSITWNFVHRVHEDAFARYLEAGGAAEPTVSWFCSDRPGTRAALR